MHEATKTALIAQQKKQELKTRKKLQLALLRLVNGNPSVVPKGTKISATSVAKEAGVDRSTIYRNHEPVLMEIRRINDTGAKALLKESRSARSQAKTTMREYRKLVEQAQKEVASLARINHRLDARVEELEGIIRDRDKMIADLQKRVNGVLPFRKNP